MGAAIGGVLPLALGIAISPIPVIAAILMLLSAKARAIGTGFLIGWVLGIVAATTVFTLISSAAPERDPDAATPVRGIIQVVLGVLLLLLALQQWRRRPKARQDAELPRWMQAIDRVSFWAALGLGFAFAAANPKNLLLAAAAGTDIGADSTLTVGAIVVVIAIFTVVAASTVLVPVVGYLVAAARLRAPLDALRGWLARENAVIMAVLLLVLGVELIGKGIAHF